jgi:transposase InsO family protein
VLAAHGVVQSMSGKGDSRHEAQRAIFEFIEVWYNRQRRHSALGYVSPVQHERQLGQQVARAA